MIVLIMLVNTYHKDYGALKKGASVSVDEVTAKRWVRNGIARAPVAKAAAPKQKPKASSRKGGRK
jgi:hypothetical protein